MVSYGYIEKQIYYRKSVEGIPNAIIDINGKQYRIRVEGFVFKKNKVFFKKKDSPNQYGMLYRVPGGGS